MPRIAGRREQVACHARRRTNSAAAVRCVGTRNRGEAAALTGVASLRAA